MPSEAAGGWALADERDTLDAGARLAPLLRAGDVVTLSGALGSGKTCFARGLLGALGLTADAPSPTFPIVIAYAPPDVRLAIAHVDLYRIAAAAEADELGLDDLREDGALLIEWPERMAAWPGALALSIAPEGAGRRLTWRAAAAWAGRWPPPRS